MRMNTPMPSDQQLTPRANKGAGNLEQIEWPWEEINQYMADLDAEIPPWEEALHREMVRKFLLDRLLPPLIPAHLRDWRP